MHRRQSDSVVLHCLLRLLVEPGSGRLSDFLSVLRPPVSRRGNLSGRALALAAWDLGRVTGTERAPWSFVPSCSTQGPFEMTARCSVIKESRRVQPTRSSYLLPTRYLLT